MQAPHRLHQPPSAPHPAQECREQPAKPKDMPGEAIGRALIQKALMKNWGTERCSYSMPPFPLLGDRWPQIHSTRWKCLPALSQNWRWRFNPWQSTSAGLLAGCWSPPSCSSVAHVSLCQTSCPAGQCRGSPFPRAVAGQVSSQGIWRGKLNSGVELGHQLCARRARWDTGILLLVAPRSPPILAPPESRHSGTPPH